MTNDPFDRLEEQLRAAVDKRAARRRRVPTRALVAVAAALTLTGGVAAAAGLLNADPDKSAAERAVSKGDAAAHLLPECAPQKGRTPAPRLISGAASPAVRRQLGVFRRASKPSDQPPTNWLIRAFSAKAILRDTVRIAHTHDGARTLLFISRGSPRFSHMPTDPLACAEAARAAAIKAAEGENASVRARVLSIENGRVKLAQDLVSGATETLSFFEIAPTGRFASGGATYIRNGKIPAVSSYGSGVWHGHRGIVLWGLVPDGVTAVRVVDGSGPAGRRVKPITVPVSDNVYHAVVPRRVGPRITAVWLDKTGHVVRRTHARY